MEAHDRGEDGFHKWKKDGIATLTESVLNIASTRIPGAGAAKTVLGSTKAGAAAVKALNMTTRLADYAVPGGGWLVRGGVKLVDLGLEKYQSLRNKNATHLGEVETAPKPSPLNPEKHGAGNPSPKPSHNRPEVPSSSNGGGASGVSKSSGPGPDFLPPRNPGGPKLNPLGLNLDSNNPTTSTSGGTHPGNNPTGGHTSTSGGTSTGTGPGHSGGAGAGHGGHTGTGGASGSNAGGSHQPHTNPNGGSRPDSLLEKPRTRHDPEEGSPGARNSHEENPAGGKSPTRPTPKNPPTGSDGGDTPRTHHGQENTGPSSHGNPHGHGGESTPTGNENPARSADRPRHSPTEPVDPEHTPRPRNTTPETSPDSKHNPEQPDHPTSPEHPQRQGQESSPGEVKHPTGGDGHGEGHDQPASGGGKGPRKVPGAFYDEDGRPFYDKDGKPLEVDHGDGKRHYASDPAETYRDSHDALQKKGGGFGDDPYTGWDKDVDVFNDREPGKNHPWDDPVHDDNYHGDRQKRTDLDTTAKERTEAAKATFDDLKSYGMKPEGKSFRHLIKELEKISYKLDSQHGDRVNEILEVLDDAAEASNDAGRASEWLGERAAVHRNKDLGRDTIIGDPPDNPKDFTRTGPGKVDVAAIEGDKTFVVDEAKSGDSPNYSSRATENGVRAQQGTLDYIKDLLSGKNQDPRILETLTRLKQEGKHPKFFENLAAGKVELAYELIQARTNGNVTASNFRIAPPGGKIMLTWDGKGDLKITIIPKGK